MVDIDSPEDGIILFEVDLQKPRNLSTSGREECGHGEGVCVYTALIQSESCLLLIGEARAKYRTHIRQ